MDPTEPEKTHADTLREIAVMLRKAAAVPDGTDEEQLTHAVKCLGRIRYLVHQALPEERGEEDPGWLTTPPLPPDA